MIHERWQVRILKKICDGRAYLKSRLEHEEKYSKCWIFSSVKDAETAIEISNDLMPITPMFKIDGYSFPRFTEEHIVSSQKEALDFKAFFHNRISEGPRGVIYKRIVKIKQLSSLNPDAVHLDPRNMLKAQELAIKEQSENKAQEDGLFMRIPSITPISDRQSALIESIYEDRKEIEKFEKETNAIKNSIDNAIKNSIDYESGDYGDQVDLKEFAELLGGTVNRLWQLNAHAMRALSEGNVLFYGGTIFPMADPYARKKYFDLSEVKEFILKAKPKKKGKKKPVRVDRFDKHQNNMLLSVIAAKEFIENFPVAKWRNVGVDTRFKPME